MLGIGLDRWFEVRVVGQRRVAAHAVVVLDATFGGQAVVIPAHRVEDLLAPHPLVTSDGVGVGVGEHVPGMQMSRDGRRRGVDGEHCLAGLHLVAMECVELLVLPDLAPFGFEPLQGWLVGHHAASRRAVFFVGL